MKTAKRLTFMSAVMAAVVALGLGTALAVPIPNGNFESGNLSFNSSYSFNNIIGGMLQEGSYSVGTNPNAVHTLWSSLGDHTSGAGNMMIVNGDTQANVQVWASPKAPDTISVDIGQTYYFAAWLTSVYPQFGNPPTAPATLAFSINGSQIGSDFTLSANVGTWELFYVPWVADAAFANLSLINRNTVAQGNDFALDDISLTKEIPTVPEPATLLLLGFGVIGLAGFGRKRFRG